MSNDNDDYAGFWIRTSACLIDLILFSIIFVPVLWGIYGESVFNTETYLGAFIPAGIWDFLIQWILIPIIIAKFWVRYSATPGQMLFNIRVLDSSTRHSLTVGQGIIRLLTSTLSFYCFFIGCIWVAFSRKKQSWHDLIAGTIVVRVIKTVS
jgi:uncharacterized RDD family membrane protein YckC